MKPRDYCCCAIPVMNVGIYATLAEQFLLAQLVAILALATPDIVGASVPSFGKIILAIVCFAAAGTQVFGFLGVLKEKSIMFRRYTTIHIMLTVAAFSIAAAWIIMSAARHSTAVTDCESDFFVANQTTSSSGSTLDEGQKLCNIFTWVCVGLMAGLWVILAIMQLYLYTVISSYGTGQRRDHDEYKSVYAVTGVESGAIPLADRADPWDARPSVDEDSDARRKKGESAASTATMLAERPQQEAASIHSERPTAERGGYPPQRQGTYASTRQGSVGDNTPYGGPNAGYPYPSNAYTQEPQPTPTAYGSNAAYYGGGYGYGNNNTNLEMPARTQAHPAQGMFGRKTTRLQKMDRSDYGY